MTLKYGFGKCSLFVLSANGWKDQNMRGLFIFLPKKILIWRRRCSIGQSCCSMTSKQSIDWFLESCRDMKFFYPTVCLTSQKTRAFVSARWTNHIALFPFVTCFGFVRPFSFQGQTKIALSVSIEKFRSGDPGAGRRGPFKNKNNPWIWLNFFEVVVNGGWGNWSDWSACSASCGPGNSIRTRRCDSPPPGPGGNPCVGLRLENKPCNLRPCLTGKYTEQDQHMYKCE